MSDTVVLALTALLALGVLGWTLWSVLHIARRTPTRQRALSQVLASIAGTALLGVILPAVLMGALDPFPIWLIYAGLTVASAVLLAWCWPALDWGGGRHPGLLISSAVLLVIVAMAGVAVT
jgi:hypothetical protein